MSTLLGLTLLSYLSAAELTSADVPQVNQRSVSIESSSHLADVGGHSDEGLTIRQQGDSSRIALKAGTTLMEGSSLSEASGRVPAGLIRRASVSAPRRTETASSELQEVQVEKQGMQTRKAKTRAVSWEACSDGKCKCYSRRRVVIRYQRENGGSIAANNVLTNWWTRQRACTGNHACPYNETSAKEFSKGFKDGANALRMCGGDGEWAKDCLQDHQPEPCSFADDTNKYDAKEGEYCCNGDMQYCSYRCSGEEEFACPSYSKEKNFPGGMDPAGPDVFKKCYMAQYPHGSNPEAANDGDVDDDTDDDDVHAHNDNEAPDTENTTTGYKPPIKPTGHYGR